MELNSILIISSASIHIMNLKILIEAKSEILKQLNPKFGSYLPNQLFDYV